MIWNGINLDYYAQDQTLHPKRRGKQHMYSSFDTVGYSWFDWDDLIPAIPLDVRFASFKGRLDRALGKRGIRFPAREPHQILDL